MHLMTRPVQKHVGQTLSTLWCVCAASLFMLYFSFCGRVFLLLTSVRASSLRFVSSATPTTSNRSNEATSMARNDRSVESAYSPTAKAWSSVLSIKSNRKQTREGQSVRCHFLVLLFQSRLLLASPDIPPTERLSLCFLPPLTRP